MVEHSFRPDVPTKSLRLGSITRSLQWYL